MRFKGQEIYPDGKTMETGVGSLLIKKFGQERLKYWRTTNKQEIDFIITGKNPKGFEVKKKFPGIPSAFKYFESQYPGSALNVFALEGKAGKARNFLYPWEIYREISLHCGGSF